MPEMGRFPLVRLLSLLLNLASPLFAILGSGVFQASREAAAMVGGGKPLGDSVFAAHAAAGAAAISASAVAVHPLDTVKTLLQFSTAGQKQKMGLRQVVDRLMATSGPAGMYSGIGWSIMGKLPGLGARFGTYELLTAFYKDGREDSYVFYSEAMLAGIAAGAVEAVFCTPFELLKLRNQVSSVIPSKAMGPANVAKESFPLLAKLLPGYIPDMRVWNNTLSLLSDLSPKHPDMLGALKQHPWMLTGSGKPPLPSDVQLPSRVISLEGWGALWRGLRPGIARDCVFGGIFFSTWQFIHTALLTWKAVNMSPEPRNLEEAGPVHPFASSVAAGFAGAIAAAASHTFDTAKSRSECTVVPKYIALERKFLKWKAPGTWIERKTGISPADRNVLFRGIGLRMARSGIASFVLVGSYYLVILVLPLQKWRGLRPGIARDCVFGGIFFSTWQFIHTALLTWKAVNMSPEPRNLEEAGPVHPFASSVAAGFAGAVAAAASHTFDTAKSRSECTVVPKYIALERKFLKWKAPGTWIERKTGISPADRNVLFRGIGLRMARSGIASFVLVGSYYLVVNHLS